MNQNPNTDQHTDLSMNRKRGRPPKAKSNINNIPENDRNNNNQPIEIINPIINEIIQTTDIPPSIDQLDFFNDDQLNKSDHKFNHKSNHISDHKSSTTHRELDNINGTFNDLMLKITNVANNSSIDRTQVHNHLLKFYHKLDSLIHEFNIQSILINSGVNSNININNLNQNNQNNQNNTNIHLLDRHYDVKNDINLINLSGIKNDDTESIANITELLSEPEFISHIVKQDTFLNKYNVIIHDSNLVIPK